jgi:hypothetical protein
MIDLVNAAMETCYMMDKTTIPDGYGGFKTVYVKGAEIQVAFSFTSSTEARIAAAQGISNRHTLYTKKNLTLRFPDVIQRDKNGKYYRITSDGDDKATPDSAGLDLRAVEAEEWELPIDG